MTETDSSSGKSVHCDVFPREHELISSNSNSNHITNTTIPTTNSSLITAYLESELVTRELDNIREHLWFAGLPRVTVPLKHLHHHRVLGRKIVLTEKIELHLITRGDIIHLKPVPHFLFQYDFFHSHVRRRAFFQHALGFLSTYISIIKYESDFRLAKEHHLLPEGIDWNRWLHFSDAIEKYLEDGKPTPCYLIPAKRQFDPNHRPNHRFKNRFDYGELRLKRLNVIMR